MLDQPRADSAGHWSHQLQGRVCPILAVLSKLVAVSCAGDIDNFCATTRPGEGRIALCLTEQLEQESKGNVEGKHLA